MADVYGEVSTDNGNDLFCVLEKFGTHQQQYAVLLSTLIAFSKIMGDNVAQLHADISANYDHVPAPQIVREH